MNKTTLLPGSLMLVPLLGASDSFVKASSLWGISVVVVLGYGVLSRTLRRWMTPELALPAQTLVAASVVSLVSLGLQAWAWELSQALGIYVALLSVQCLALEHLGFFEREHLRRHARVFGLFGGLLIATGLIRELLANATLFNHWQWWTGKAVNESITVFASQNGFRLAGLIPGAFLLLGLLVAGKRAWSQRSTSTPRASKEMTTP